jgi:predicted choloylglycine hydrolase
VWYLGEGEGARTDLAARRAVFSRHMPELVPTYDRLCDLAGNDDVASCFLSMVNPPAYLAGCSQLAWTGAEPALIRNYDFSPSLFEGVVTRTQWVRPVIGVSEGTWGLLDGMNADGLAICLSFGGRKIFGKGFGIPLIVRFLLETCATVSDACDRARSLPVHMAYSITMLDAAKNFATVHLSPDHDAVVTSDAACTNHQPGAEWAEHAVAHHSVERKECLDTLLHDPLQDRTALIGHFLRSPLRNTQYQGTSGTLYTVAYEPLEGAVEMVWPSQRVRLSFDDFEERIIHVDLLPSTEQTATV